MHRPSRAETIDDSILQRAKAWLHTPFDPQTSDIVHRWIEQDPYELKDAFWKDLEFGTGGMRGVMGVGSNRMNIYTIRRATQGLCNWLNAHKNKPLKAVLAYDSRHHSKEFALEASKVFAANGITTYIFAHLRPTPVLSFAIRHLGADCGVMITASHNPPIYNGFKAYNSQGCQFYSPNDKSIISYVNECPFDIVKVASIDDPLIHILDESIDEAFLQAISLQQQTPDINQHAGKGLKIVYTNLHGTGGTMAIKALKKWGFCSVHEVLDQAQPDGNFSTVAAPNPEDASAMDLGVQQLLAQNGDLLLANDPDADRIGVAVNAANKSRLLSGQEIAILLCDHMLEHYVPQGAAQAAVIKSLVTSDLLHLLCNERKVKCFDVLPGFKYVGRLIRQWQDNHAYRFLFGAEESHGYLAGLHARDKDGIVALCLMAEAALKYKLQNLTLVDRLEQIYQKHGRYTHKLMTISQSESSQGYQKMQAIMKKLRQCPPKELAGFTVERIYDLLEDAEEPLAPSDVLVWYLKPQASVIIRPSGTEPKIKVYLNLTSEPSASDYNLTLSLIEHSLKQLLV